MRLIMRISSIPQECAVVVLMCTPSAADRVRSRMGTRCVYFSDIGRAIRMSEFIFLSRRIDLKPPCFQPRFYSCSVAVERGRRHSAVKVLTFMRANGAVYGYKPQARSVVVHASETCGFERIKAICSPRTLLSICSGKDPVSLGRCKELRGCTPRSAVRRVGVITRLIGRPTGASDSELLNSASARLSSNPVLMRSCLYVEPLRELADIKKSRGRSTPGTQPVCVFFALRSAAAK